ncbi:MAG: hypothetical protein K5872_08965 [Rhizobiaceae bacterium]|nr:hypothetical protein [Rhizobiaceae bacterium]MCV0406345.1 hypothetical protein [Rhizobiaceae bacterium]
MSKFIRILACVFLAAFAAGTAANAAASTEMSLIMSMSSMDHDMADCQDCPGDDAQVSACDQFCVIILAAICTPAGTDLPNVADTIAIRTAAPPGDRAGPPDPYPPRTTHLG